jgi:TfoX/Sxy family transcriptional regulator of competence genes
VSTSKETVAYIEDQLDGLDIRTTRMFGEYGIYCDNKVVGFICDDTLFIKPSPVDPAVLEGTVLAPAYPGSKDYHSVPGDLLEHREWLHTAIQSTADALPVPPPKKATAKKPRPSAGGGGV